MRSLCLPAAALAGLFALQVPTFAAPPMDEARAAGKKPSDLPELAIDLFKDMDNGIALSPDEIKGRNTWMIWTAGNQAFWNHIAQHSFGTIDLLKILDSRKRSERFNYYGLMNEPGFKQASKPDAFGLWLDVPSEPEAAGVDPAIYGRSSGIVGLRLFPNPEFTPEAAKRWDAERYYGDRSYYYDPKLIRPYRVGMSCAFCHVSFHPLHPPVDPAAPTWKNLSTNIGAQYFWVGRIFGYDLENDDFVKHLLNSAEPGALDTSFIASDNINNPRTMNAIYNVAARLETGHEEQLTGGALDFPGNTAKMKVPHILKDGADSIGVLGALARVYLNIGEFHQEWLTHFSPMVGFKPQTPIEVKVMQANSTYWLAGQERVGNLAKFFVKAALPTNLADAPGGQDFLPKDAGVVARGKVVFADNCASCHSSKQPPKEMTRGTPEYQAWMRTEVAKPDFLQNNYLSIEARIPVTVVRTNACAALATNAVRGHIWDNFSSETYKTLPSVGDIDVINPVTREPWKFQAPAGGPGYYRVPSLVSVWASAPFLHNNALGIYTNDPSTAGRMKAFDDAAEKLLWPQKRENRIYRTSGVTFFKLNEVFLPDLLKPLADDDGYLRIGPIPAGTPINLLANLDVTVDLKDPKHVGRLLKLLTKIKFDLARIKLGGLSETESTALLKELVPDLLKLSNCPDFVADRGHEFGAELPDADKRALIEFMKLM